MTKRTEEASSPGTAPTRPGADPSGLRLKDIMSTSVVTVSPEFSLRDLIELLDTEEISGVPVVSGTKVVGVVSATDLLRFEHDAPSVTREGEVSPSAYFTDYGTDAGADVSERFSTTDRPEGDALDEHTVSEIMSRTLYTLTPEAEVHEAAEYMIRTGVHRLLVVRDLDLVGIVTATDILRAVAERRI